VWHRLIAEKARYTTVGIDRVKVVHLPAARMSAIRIPTVVEDTHHRRPLRSVAPRRGVSNTQLSCEGRAAVGRGVVLDSSSWLLDRRSTTRTIDYESADLGILRPNTGGREALK
jgi:hypothetical protein